MEGSSERSRWNSSEVYEAMQRYQSTQAPLQEHVGSVRVTEFFQLPRESHIPLLPPLIMDMCTNNLKATEDIGDDDVQIIAPPTPKK